MPNKRIEQARSKLGASMSGGARCSCAPRWAHLGGDVAIGVVLEVSGVLRVVKPDISKRWFCKPAGRAERP